MRAKTFFCCLFNRFYGICCSIFSTQEIIFSSLKVPLPRYGRNCSFSNFENGFKSFTVLFLAIWRLFLVNRRYRFQETSENVHSLVLHRFSGIHYSIFSNLEIILVDRRYCCQDISENVNSPSFKLVLWHWLFYFQHWSLFLVDWNYRCQYTGENIHFLTMKLVLRHLLFQFQRFEGYFASIKNMVAKIRGKYYLTAFKEFLRHQLYLFSALFRFLVNRMYHYQDTGKNVHFPTLKFF